MRLIDYLILQNNMSKKVTSKPKINNESWKNVILWVLVLSEDSIILYKSIERPTKNQVKSRGSRFGGLDRELVKHSQSVKLVKKQSFFRLAVCFQMMSYFTAT